MVLYDHFKNAFEVLNFEHNNNNGWNGNRYDLGYRIIFIMPMSQFAYNINILYLEYFNVSYSHIIISKNRACIYYIGTQQFLIVSA